RKQIVEHPFGTIKFWNHQNAFLMKGLEKVRAEFSLSTLAYNIKRVINIVRVDKDDRIPGVRASYPNRNLGGGEIVPTASISVYSESAG
ncbi:MAG: hypothetical protein WBK96_01145, partial [Candidatus Manganitrophaceae bacterium]